MEKVNFGDDSDDGVDDGAGGGGFARKLRFFTILQFTCHYYYLKWSCFFCLT